MRIEYNNDNNFTKKLGLMLLKYNQNNCKYIYDNSDNEHDNKINANFKVLIDDIIVGGASGWIQFGWYYLDHLFVDEKYRKKGIGTEIIKTIEKFAIKNNCFGIKLETWDFQAKDFYQKLGYEVYAILENYPPGSIEYSLKKVL